MGAALAAARPPAFRLPVRVYYQDTDAGGVVFHATYLDYFERARTEWLRSLGVEQGALRERLGAMFVVSRTAMRYLRPARLDDLLEVTVAVRDAARVSLHLEQQALRGTELLVEGEIRIACVDAPTLKPRRIPDEVLNRLP
jgi:acyl-CoA thioester hydrolase